MTALLIDLDGVIYKAEEPVPGAAEAIAGLRGRMQCVSWQRRLPSAD